MRVVPVLLALSLGLVGASTPQPEPCELALVVDDSAPEPVLAASAHVVDRLAAHDVAATVTTAPGIPAADQMLDLSRLAPSWWPRSDTVAVFTRPSVRDDELGRVDHRAGEVHLNAAYVDDPLFPSALWADVLAHELGHLAGLEHTDGGVMATGLPLEELWLTDDDVAQVAAAWCGRPAPEDEAA